MATYAIGDVQGCYSVLRRLLDHIDFAPERDQLLFAGDIVNRGPESLQVLRFVKQLDVSAITVLGNHDLHLLACLVGVRSVSIQDTLEAVLQAPDRDELMHWLRLQPLVYALPTCNAVLVHAGVYPTWSLSALLAYATEVEAALRSAAFEDCLRHVFGNEPACWQAELQGWSRLRFIVNACTRMRFCSADGALDLVTKAGIEQAPPAMSPWFNQLDVTWGDKRILFGHWAALHGRTNLPHCIALDTGAVWGQHLTAYCLETQHKFSVSGYKA